MSDSQLIERAGQLGFPLFEASDDNVTLADVARSKDLRLWEGFPVMIANAAERGGLHYEKIKSLLKRPIDIQHLNALILMSLALYQALNIDISWARDFSRSLSEPQKEEIALLTKKIQSDSNLPILKYTLSGQRLKTIFRNYFNGAPRMQMREFLSDIDEASLQYSLSQIFSARQKELIVKKLKGDKLTKTEKEYYSRVVKKKLSALANPDLHRLAQRALQ
jgi:hypothetical protein